MNDSFPMKQDRYTVFKDQKLYGLKCGKQVIIPAIYDKIQKVIDGRRVILTKNNKKLHLISRTGQLFELKLGEYQPIDCSTCCRENDKLVTGLCCYFNR